jgi:hypothetical protein
MGIVQENISEEFRGNLNKEYTKEFYEKYKQKRKSEQKRREKRTKKMVKVKSYKNTKAHSRGKAHKYTDLQESFILSLQDLDRQI